MLKKTFGIIPARLHSSRLQDKLLLDIAGKPLIQHTFENAKKCRDLEEVFIATDSDEIASAAKDFGAQVIMTSPHCQSGTERIIDAYFNDERLKRADILVNVQGDEPLIEVEVIEAVVDALTRDLGAVASTAITPLTDPRDANDPSVVKCVTDLNHYALYFSRALIPGNKLGQFNPLCTYYKHIGIYGYRTSFLPELAEMSETPLQLAEDLEQLKIIEQGYNLKTAIVVSNSIGVDTLEDLERVKRLFNEVTT